MIFMDQAKVYFDGSLLGFYEDPKKLMKEIKKLRRENKLSSSVNISYMDSTNEVYINTSAGRIQRPLIVVENGKPKVTPEHIEKIKKGTLTFEDLIKNGLVEYLDAEEEDIALVAIFEKDITKEHTHLELDPVVLFGFVVGMIPYVNQNPPGKSLHGAKMFKQAVGYCSPNQGYRVDTDSYELYYPQKHLVKTKVMDLFNSDERAVIQNFVVAIMPYYGYNMQDAVILNGGAIDRGLGRLSYYRTYTSEETIYPGGLKDSICYPDEDVEDYLGTDAYSILGPDGIAEVETFVSRKNVIIGKTSPPKYVEEISEFGVLKEKRIDSSMEIRKNKEGYVDKVFLNSDGIAKKVKVKIRTPKIPELGDKFASKHGQKGVVGYVAKEEDMPFSVNGLKPDLILNPHSIPARMTVGHLVEMLAGTAACASGKEVDGTAYSGSSVEDLKKILTDNGFSPTGTETFYDGLTGKKVVGEVFTGQISYRRLYHFVSHKMQARSRGPVQMLTRQPTEGMEKEGGLKFGEMETDCLIGYGATMLLNEKLLDDSDKIVVPVCKRCGIVAVSDNVQKKTYCNMCNKSEIAKVAMPYAFKIFMDELRALMIYPRLSVKEF